MNAAAKKIRATKAATPTKKSSNKLKPKTNHRHLKIQPLLDKDDGIPATPKELKKDIATVSQLLTRPLRGKTLSTKQRKGKEVDRTASLYTPLDILEEKLLLFKDNPLLQVDLLEETETEFALNYEDLEGCALHGHDEVVYEGNKTQFLSSLKERFDLKYTKGPFGRAYVTVWTNRVAMWRFYERFYTPILSQYLDSLLPYINYQMESLFPPDHPARSGNTKTQMQWLLNPFHGYADAFAGVLKAWSPAIKGAINTFVRYTRDGWSHQSEFESTGNLAFLYALEKQAMGILSSSRHPQTIPFSYRLSFAIKKEIYAVLPNITGPYKVPIESPDRHKLPYTIGLEEWIRIESGD